MKFVSRRPAIGYALVASAAITWGFWPYFLRRAEHFGGLDPALESAAALAAGTILSGALVFRDRVAVRASPVAWCAVVWLGVSDALNALLLFRAYQTTTVTIAVLTHYLAPLMVAVLAPLVLRERADRTTTAAVVLSFAGLVLLLEPWQTRADHSVAIGAMYGAASALFYASNVLVNKKLVPIFSGSEMMFFHGVVAVPLLAFLVPRTAWRELDPRALVWLFMGALFSGALAGLFFVWGLRSIPASRASTLTLLEPLVAAVVVGGVIYGEPIRAFGIAGGALILAGAAVVLSRASA